MSLKNKIIGLALFTVCFYGILANGKRAFAGACFANGGTCWAVENCNDYMSKGKDLIPVPAGDAACAQAYSSPVKCCKIGGVSSSKPAATQNGSDTATTGATQSGPDCPTCFTNPLRFNTVEEFLTKGLLVALQRIVVVLALLMIVIGGVMYITSAGSSQMETGKKTITAALIGLAIVIAAPSILRELSSVLGWNNVNNAAVQAAPTFTVIALRVLNFMLGIAGILALIMIVLGGVMYLSSAGDEDRAKSGKKMFQYSLLGIIIIMSGMLLITQLAKFFVG